MSEITGLTCPHCPKGKASKLYINVELGVFNCFRCEFKGSIKKLYKYPELISKLEDQLSLAESSKLKYFKPMDLKSHDILADLNPVREINYIDPQYDYLVNRGWTEEMIRAYRPLVSTASKYKDRVILPIFDNADNMIYYTARSIDGESSNKYINACVSRADIVFESAVPEALLFPDIGIICEGIFDGAKLPNCVALLGKVLSEENEKNIIKFFKSRSSIYVCLDTGTTSNMDVICSKLYSWFPNKNIYKISEDAYNGKDLGNLAETLSSVQLVSFIVNNSKLFTPPTLTSKLRNRFSLIVA